ncbi:MAG: hypothetical protein WCR59_04860 [Planctomycetota bacterium]|nr:hypothetical protein [Planctomycetota bacterium]
MNKSPFLLSLALVLAACNRAEPTKLPAAQSSEQTTATEHGHTMHLDLGQLQLGAYTLQVFQVAPVEAGKEADFDLEFAPQKPLPENVRGWIGNETGAGSRKVRFLNETASRMHGHPESPDNLASDAKFWIDIEGAGKGFVSPKR